VQQTLAKLNIIGVGPGSPDYVTPAAQKTVQNAQLVIGAQRSLNLLTSNINGETIVLTAKNIGCALKSAAETVAKGKEVALLSTGDPGFSGLLRTVLESRLFADKEINVIPGISSVQACAAKLALSWDSALLITFHEGNVSDDEKEVLDFAVSSGEDVIVIPDPKAFTPKDIAVYLLNEGRDKETPAYICENLTLSDEKITLSNLAEVSKLTFGSLCVMVIKANLEEKKASGL
jgi:cobalt-precorrin-7 (C5)-methyltransferase